MAFTGCPGASNIKGTPALEIKKCPRCGSETELFSNEDSAVCGNCGHVIYNEVTSCARWCRYAGECLGEEKYSMIMRALEEQNGGK